jgi:hypothetical protein
VYLEGGSGHQITASQTVNDLGAVQKVISDILERRTELPLPAEVLGDLKSELLELQSQISAQAPQPSLIRTSAATIKTLLEGAAGSMIATALWPTVTQVWLPALSKLLDTYSRYSR